MSVINSVLKNNKLRTIVLMGAVVLVSACTKQELNESLDQIKYSGPSGYTYDSHHYQDTSLRSDDIMPDYDMGMMKEVGTDLYGAEPKRGLPENYEPYDYKSFNYEGAAPKPMNSSYNDVGVISAHVNSTVDSYESGLTPMPDIHDIKFGSSLSVAAKDLVDQLTGSFGIPTEPVYLEADHSAMSFEPAYGEALRDALISKNVIIASVPGQGPFTINYRASSLNSSGFDVSGPDKVLTLVLKSGPNIVAEIGGVFRIGGPIERYYEEQIMDVPASTSQPMLLHSR